LRYDLDKFGAAMVVDALRTHPMVLSAESFSTIRFYVPPEELLKELNAREPAKHRIICHSLKDQLVMLL